MTTTKCAIWARVSTSNQEASNQLDQLRAWAERRGLEIVHEFVIEDSAWQNGSGGKGAAFDKARSELLNGARLGQYSVVLTWALDRLSRKGIYDTLGVLRSLYDVGADVWSHQEPWMLTTEPRMRELLVAFMAWMAEQESSRRSERTKAGLERARREGKKIGGRQAGAKDKRPRSTEGYHQAWAQRKAAAGHDNAG